MKKVISLSLVLVLVLSLCLTGCSMVKIDEEKLNKKVVAEVNGVEITRGEYVYQYESVVNYYESYLGTDVFAGESGEQLKENLQENILDSMIEQEVLKQEAEKRGFEVTDEEIQAEFDTTKEYYGDSFESALEEAGFTEETYKEEIRTSLLLSKLEEDLIKDVEVSDEEALEYYNNNQDDFKEDEDTATASHILVETEEEAKAVIERLNNGESFADLAKELSTDTASAEDGGSLGEFTRDQMVTEFSDAVFNNGVGLIKEPVKSSYGYHIINVEDVKIYEVLPFEEVKEDAKEGALSEKQETVRNERVEELKEAAEIKKYEKNLRLDLLEKEDE